MSITVTSIANTTCAIQSLSGGGASASGTASTGTAASAANNAYSSNAAIVGTLGGSGSGSQVQIYDGSSLLSRIRQIQAAGDAAASAYSAATSASTSATATTASTASAGTAAGSLEATANWATILKSRPELARVAIGYAFDQGIVNTLSTYA